MCDASECLTVSAPNVATLFDLSGKVALITGGSRGLGYQMALAFARQGADVVITSRKIESCEKVAAEIRALGRRALAHACHVGRWPEIDTLVDAAYAAFGKVDILVNNAGMSPVAPTSIETTEALFDKVVAVNFKGAFRLGALVGTRMAAGEGGSIINISSSGALFPQPGIIPYAGAKAAMNAMTTGWAKEFGPKVRVNTISPGPFLTDVADHWEDREYVDSALGRPGRPDEIITTALYLASAASSYTTAALIRVDGGL
jgi:NAD(P)-dependent dehydrogenase (short-subunit alcohol dehydrogenase family)